MRNLIFFNLELLSFFRKKAERELLNIWTDMMWDFAISDKDPKQVKEEADEKADKIIMKIWKNLIKIV